MALPVHVTQVLINGEFKDAISGNTFETVSPTTGKVIASVPHCSKEDVDVAVAAARAALEKGAWATSTGAMRTQLLIKLATLIERDSEYLAQLETADNGMAIGMSRWIIGHQMGQLLRYVAGLADKLEGKTIPTESGQFVYTLREPLGVCGLIIPWNFPLSLTLWKLAPAMAAGCTVVIKPSEKSPLTALYLGKLLVEAGFPAGVVNIVTGFGDLGAALSDHMGVDKVAFTGSVVTARKVMIAAASSNLKKVSLELGGKSPHIVFSDADIDSAAQIAHDGLFLHQGQVCCAGSRVFVQADIYDAFVKKSTELAKTRKIGDPADLETKTGPIVDQLQMDRVLEFIEKGKQEGAKLECGGARIERDGFFVEPTVFSGVSDDMLIAREEIFGPVMSIIKFTSIDEVIERANNTWAGLACAVLTNDLTKAHKIANSVRAGTVWVNTYGNVLHQAPFGGYKMSGFGRELGSDCVNEYLNTKSVIMSLKRV